MSTITLSSPLVVSGNLTINAGDVLACGVHQVTCAGNITNTPGVTGITGSNTFVFNGTSILSGNTNFYKVLINVGKTITLTSGQTFTATNTFTANAGSLNRITINATTPSSSAELLTPANTVVNFVNATDINSSGGNNVKDVGGTLLRTSNWSSLAGITPLPGYYPLM